MSDDEFPLAFKHTTTVQRYPDDWQPGDAGEPLETEEVTTPWLDSDGSEITDPAHLAYLREKNGV